MTQDRVRARTGMASLRRPCLSVCVCLRGQPEAAEVCAVVCRCRHGYARTHNQKRGPTLRPPRGTSRVLLMPTILCLEELIGDDCSAGT